VAPGESWTQRTYLPTHVAPGSHRAIKAAEVDDDDEDATIRLTTIGPFEVFNRDELQLPRRWNVAIDSKGVHDPRTETTIPWKKVVHVSYREAPDQICVAPDPKSGFRSVYITAQNTDLEIIEVLAAIKHHSRAARRHRKLPLP